MITPSEWVEYFDKTHASFPALHLKAAFYLNQGNKMSGPLDNTYKKIRQEAIRYQNECRLIDDNNCKNNVKNV